MTIVAAQEALIVDNPAISARLLKDLTLIVIGIARNDVPSALPEAVHTVWFDGVRDGKLNFSDVNGAEFQVMEAPLMPLAVLADPGAAGDANTLFKWLQRQGVVQLPAVVTWKKGQEINAIASVVALAGEHVKAAAKRLVLSNRELRTLRSLNDDLQNRFAAIETFLSRHGLQPLDLVFSNEPAESQPDADIFANASDDGISQVLPVASSGVSGVALHLDSQAARQDLVMRAKLIALEDLRVVDTWQIASGDLMAGWNVFGLSKSIAGLNRTLEFRLQVEETSEDVPRLSLGDPQPIEMFQVRDASNGMPLLKHSLALQVWGGIPGVAMPPSANYIPARSQQASAGEGFRDVPVAPGILEHATLANSDEVSFEFEAIMPLPTERAVGCHPPRKGITIGELPGACPPQTVRMSAKAFIDNSRSADIDFAIAVAADLEAAKAMFKGERQQAAGEAFSGWKTVSYGDSAHISAFASDQVITWQNVYFATRMSVSGRNAFAWAKFANFRAIANG